MNPQDENDKSRKLHRRTRDLSPPCEKVSTRERGRSKVHVRVDGVFVLVVVTKFCIKSFVNFEWYVSFPTLE